MRLNRTTRRGTYLILEQDMRFGVSKFCLSLGQARKGTHRLGEDSGECPVLRDGEIKGNAQGQTGTREML